MSQTFRDRVMDAMLARFVSICGRDFAQYTRRFTDWQKLSQETEPLAQPMLILFDGVGLGGGYDTVVQKGRATPAIITLNRTIIVYQRLPGGVTPEGPNTQTPGGTPYYSLMESIERALLPDDGSQNVLTLGGLVSHCWIEGDVFYVTGETDPTGQGMITIPLKIMLYPNSA